jgi:hypothetical protein
LIGRFIACLLFLIGIDTSHTGTDNMDIGAHHRVVTPSVP